MTTVILLIGRFQLRDIYEESQESKLQILIGCGSSLMWEPAEPEIMAS